ncbi:unnamed protein product [Symbiodinium necroappetens]|uniref:CCHC-type domain-containing protein n=1 Tax=Symbiodinium necroappetens TaxID=1628268 RepID=A0A812JN10_9DINO|nr:unnamed protein product [Symbiodinium necroappetens]
MVSLDGSVDPVRARGNTQCGFELLRQLTQQYSLRSRAEALSMRSELINRIFALRASDTSVATQVGDVIRKIDLELAKFAKLLGTLPEAFDRSGLSIGDGDAMVILLRSLPENAKQYVLHHSVGDTYMACRNAALKFERQQRLFLDLNLGGKPQKGVAAVTTGSPGLQTFAMDRWDDEGSWDSAWYDSQEWSDVNATTREKCNRCGKAHATDKCTTNLEKVKCFSCHEMGHIGANCPHKGKGKGKESQGKDAKGKGGKGKPGKSGGSNEKGKGKGKAGKQGKKGKMNEVSYDGDDGQWWSQEWDYNWQEPYLDQQLGQSALAESGGTQASQSAPLQMSSLLLCELMSEEMHAMQKCGIGCVVIDGVELPSARGCLIKWLHEFGLSSSTVSITMVTDSEAAVSSFVSRASDHFHFLVKKAGPQVHEAVGHAEPCVRTLKEALQVLRSDMNRSNLDLKLGASALQDVVTHVCMAQNRFGKAHGANQAPQEIATGRPLPETPFSLFLSLVLAETPDSMHEKYPNSPRFVEACFIHPQWASQGSLVIGKFRKGDVLVNERFVAKSIRIVMPPKWDKTFCPEHMKTLTAAEAAGIPAEVAVPLSVGQGHNVAAPGPVAPQVGSPVLPNPVGRLPTEKRKILEQPSNVPPAEDMQVETEVERESVFRQKRRPEVETERLEREIEESRADRMVETVMELDLCWSADASPVCEILHEPSGLKSAPATAPEFFDPSIESIKFEHGEHEHVKRTLGGRTVLVWKPTSAVDDTTLQLLDRDLTFKGMCAEVEHLEQCSAGRLVDEAEAKALEDLNKGASARKLGFSSPTPSTEALNLLLAVVILKLPLSVSLETGLPAYLVLAVAVNGLRDASLR